MSAMNVVGKPYEGKLHVRFDEKGQVATCPLLYVRPDEAVDLLAGESPAQTDAKGFGSYKPSIVSNGNAEAV